MPTPSENARVDGALARAVIARTLRGIFRPPDSELLQPLSCGEGREALAAAAALIDPEGDFGALEAARSLPSPAATDLPDLRARYERLFGHTLRGEVCPYETEYGSGPPFQQEQELADLAGFFLAFGLRPPGAADERLDHVACELEFFEFLGLKEAWALGHDDTEMAEITRAAARRFLRKHLGRFGVAFGRSLEQADQGRLSLYGAAGALCSAYLRACCRLLDVPAGAIFIELRPSGDDRVPMARGEGCDPVNQG